MKIRNLLIFLLLGISILPISAGNNLEPLKSERVRAYRETAQMTLPIISWGADIKVLHANGDNQNTSSGSLFGRSGLNFKIQRMDNFQDQLNSYLRGDTVYLRGTMGMINAAAEVANKDRRTEIVVVYQLSFSSGGDALVVKNGINRVSDLRGKTIAIQKYGPHMDYLVKLLADAGLSTNDVNILWTEDFIGPDGNTPMAKFYESNVDAAFVITPDALALTSNGTVGTGSEESVRGAKILMSTKTADSLICDVYGVRRDYFEANRSKVEAFVKALMQSDEEVKDLYNKKDSAYRRMISSSAEIILDSSSAVADMEAMAFSDARMADFGLNNAFFSGGNNGRNFERLNNDIQSYFTQLGVMTSSVSLQKANWDYNRLSSGLRNTNVTAVSKFDENAVITTTAKMQQQGTLDEAVMFHLEIFFQPNQMTFDANTYEVDFDKVVDLATTYGGALITIEGHSDPYNYLKRQRDGASSVELERIKQTARNLSFQRANAIRDSIIASARIKGIILDPAQFVVIGHGITRPRYNPPENEQEWLANMRADFNIIQVEAESSVFEPLF